ncbi:DUF3793 family protein [Treponema zioleckii]|uniref:DUF3793 family protein n=1 Tax=Treponema zioleckii TaxID=331680 RepID=UPI00168B37FC|nr:DUF3793 family protein [Treponema zioleckii]
MSFDETIIHCSAPSLCGIKPASLFSMNSTCYDSGIHKLRDWQSEFSKSKKYFVPLKKSEKRILFFVFDKNLLEKVCSDSSNLAYLKSKGYEVHKGFNVILSELLHRLAWQKKFPHEVGLFLGYPLVDVVGFEKNSSECKFAGFWKVYGDKKSAVEQMNLYKKCSDICMKWIDDGLSVPLSIKKFGGLKWQK